MRSCTKDEAGRHRASHLVLAALLSLLPAASAPEFRTERLPVAGGSELITIFENVPGTGPAVNGGDTAPIPLLSVLRDGLGGQAEETDRLRYVWVLTSPPPSLLQRAAGSVPFLYWRAGPGANPDHRPAAVLDLGAPARNLWRQIAGWILQALAFDPRGALIRSSTRSYRNNLADNNEVRATEGLAVLSELSADPGLEATFSQHEMLEINARLTLNDQMLGGLVEREDLDSIYAQQLAGTAQMRGHNWELLRQRAEANGLYFDAFGFNGSSAYALLWIPTESLGSPRKFDPQFLDISNPFGDRRLKNWKGYRDVRDGQEMIPLALYALENPKAPLLLVDFRDPYSPKAREMLRHFFTDLVTGVAGLSKLANWPYLAGAAAFEFIRARHGEANDRSARLKAYAEVREWLELDDAMEPGLRHALQGELDRMGVNPMERAARGEAEVAKRQYAALVRYAADPNGLPARIERDRSNELAAYRHSVMARVGYRAANVASLGVYSHREKETGEDLRVQLEERRRIEADQGLLEKVERSDPQAEVVWNPEEVCRAVEEIDQLGHPHGSTPRVDQSQQTKCAKQALLAGGSPGTQAESGTEAQ